VNASETANAELTKAACHDRQLVRCGAGFFVEAPSILSRGRRKTMIDPGLHGYRSCAQCELVRYRRFLVPTGSPRRTSEGGGMDLVPCGPEQTGQQSETHVYALARRWREICDGRWCIGAPSRSPAMTKMGLAPSTEPRRQRADPQHKVIRIGCAT